VSNLILFVLELLTSRYSPITVWTCRNGIHYFYERCQVNTRYSFTKILRFAWNNNIYIQSIFDFVFKLFSNNYSYAHRRWQVVYLLIHNTYFETTINDNSFSSIKYTYVSIKCYYYESQQFPLNYIFSIST